MKKAQNIQVGRRYIYRALSDDCKYHQYEVEVSEVFDDEVAKVFKVGEDHQTGKNVWITNLYEIES